MTTILLTEKPKMALPKQQSSLKSSCLEVVLTKGELSSQMPSPLPELPQTLAKELELITITGPGPVKITRIQWTRPQVPSPNSREFTQFSELVQGGGDSDNFATMSRRTGGNATPSGLAEVWRPEPGTWRFLHRTWRLRRNQDAQSIFSNFGAVVENSSIIHHNPVIDYTYALRFLKKHLVTEESRLSHPFSCTEKAVYDKIDAMEFPEVEDTRDWPEDDWDEWFEEFCEKSKLMIQEERSMEEGWEALPFPELQPLVCGVFLASSVEYSWPGYLPGGEWQEEYLRECFQVPKLVKVSKEGERWRLHDFAGACVLVGEGDSIVKMGGTLESMKMLASGQLLLTRKCHIPGSDNGGQDYRGASFTLYSPI